MTDIFTCKKRSAVMSASRSRGDAATELRLIALFRAPGITGWRRGDGGGGGMFVHGVNSGVGRARRGLGR